MKIELFEELQEILETMSIPENKKKNLNWLARNINANNSQHKDIDRAHELIRFLLRSK